MGLLDELKQQADQKRVIVAQEEAEQAARDQSYRDNILPVMLKLFRYLSDLVEQLNFIDKPIIASYPIKTYDTLTDLEQRDFKIRSDSMENMKQIDFSFECVGEGKVEFQVENKLYIERLEEYLNSVRLNYICNKYKDSRHNVTSARFRVDKHVTVEFSFLADIEAGVIRLELRNYHGLHLDRFTIYPDTVDDAFLDELGKFILRQETTVFQLEISDEERERIRERLGRDKKKTRKRMSKKSANKSAKTKTTKKKSKHTGEEAAEPDASPGNGQSMLAAAVLAGKALPDDLEDQEASDTAAKAASQAKQTDEVASTQAPADSFQAEQPVNDVSQAKQTDEVASTQAPADSFQAEQPVNDVSQAKQTDEVASTQAPADSFQAEQPVNDAAVIPISDAAQRISVQAESIENQTQPEAELQPQEESPDTAVAESASDEVFDSDLESSITNDETDIPIDVDAAASGLREIENRDADNDLKQFELQFSALPAAFNTYESLGDSGQHIIQKLTDLKPFPAQLLKQAVQVLEELNKTTLDVDERVELAEGIFRQVYPVLADLYFSQAKGSGKKDKQAGELGSADLVDVAIDVIDEITTAYKHAFKALYTPNRTRFTSQSRNLTYWGFRILELLRLDQRLRALRYQKIPRTTWLDCNQVFFSLLLHEAIDDQHTVTNLIGLVPSRKQCDELENRHSTVRRIYLSIQLFGVLDVITWPASLFHFADDYLDEIDGGLNIEQDSGEVLTPGWLITFLQNDGPPLHKRNDAIPTPALRIDFSGLFAGIVDDHEKLANMLFLNAVDDEQLSPALAVLDSQDRIPVLEMMLLALQRRERKHTRHAVFGTEKLLVNFGFTACFTNLSGFSKPEGVDVTKSAHNVELIQQKSIQLAESHPPFAAVPWKILNFSAGGLLVATDSVRFKNSLQVGQLAAFKPKNSQDLPLMGFVGRIQRPVDNLTEISIIRMAKHAEAAIAQDHAEMKQDSGKAVILMQDFDGRWQIIALHEYGYTTGTPLKLIRGNGVRILLRLGDIWMTKRDFTVFEVRSANL